MKRSQQQTQATPTGHVPAASATKSRRGFTLVELLVVIAIIGILIGMLAVSIGPVLTRVYDGAVSTEMGQIDLAVESFKNKYGFYPPSFSGFSNAVRASGTALEGGQNDLDMPWESDGSVPAGEELQLLPFLNKISPNHRENSGAAPTPLRTWWVNIGRHLDDRSSLVFWLSGLCANKQFPLTNGLTASGQLPVAYGVPQTILLNGNGTRNTVVNAPGIDIARDSFFDFRNAQLADEALDNLTSKDVVSADARTSPRLAPGVKVYNTPYGEEAGNRGNAYFYRDSRSYNTTGGGYHALNGGFINPRTFQIFTFGRDGLAGNVALDDPLTDPEKAQSFVVNQDNITNFANGRLEAFDWKANLGLE